MSVCNEIIFYEDINNPGMARVIEEEVRYWWEINKDTMKIKHSIFGVIRNEASPSKAQKILRIHYEGEAGCNPFACSHENNRIEVIKEANCTEFGESDRWCNDCKIFLEKFYPPGLNHDYHWVSNGDATCLEDGTKTGTCVNCGDSKVEPDEGSALGHNYVRTLHIAAGCTTDRIDVDTCSRCQDKVFHTVENSALGHSWTNEVYDNNATCTQDGTRSVTCSRCGLRTTTTAPGTALGHMYPNEWTVRTPATVTSTGIEYKRCVRCNHEITQVIPKAEFQITTDYVNGMVRGNSFSQTLTSSAPSATWSLYSGTLPTGITLSSNGKLSGTPTATGVFTFTVKCVYDGTTKTKQYSVNVAAGLVTVTFNANGGKVTETTRKVAAGSTIGTLPTPTYSGQIFGGWYTAATGGLKVDASYSVNTDMTLYARWGASSDVVFGDATTQFNMQYDGDRTNYANNPYTIYGRIAGGASGTASLVFQTGIASTNGTNNLTSSNKKITLYLKVTNNGNAGYFDVGFDADSYVVNQGNDRVQITRISNGLRFGNTLYTVTVPYAHTAWIGQFSNRTSNRYVNMSVNSVTGSSVDTGFAFTMNNIFINSGSYTILEVTFQRP